MIKVRIADAYKLGCDMSIFVSFPYDNRILEVVRSFPQKWWHADDKEWELPLNKLHQLTQKLSDQVFDITADEYIDMTPKACELPADFSFKTTPFEHQKESFMYGLSHDRWFLGDEQGLGKTKQVIDIAVAKRLQRGYKHCLIICGVNGLKWNWLNEIRTHSNENGYILGQKRNRSGRITIGGNAEKLADLDAINDIKDYFIITNVESLRSEAINTKISELCKNGTFGIVAIDEIHKCKNPTSQQGKGILNLNSEVRIAMTGTPLMNNPLDLYIILRWLGYEDHKFYAFRKHYCEMGGFGGYEIVAYKHLDELQERLDEIMIRRKKEDVLDLPEKLYIDEFVDMSAEQKRIYDEVTAEVKENIDQIKTSPNPLASLIRMRQATGYTGILSSKIKESAKLDRMEELVEEAVQNNKKVVIFSNWTQMTDVVVSRLRKYNVGVITGQTADADRQELVDRFQSGNLDIMVGTIGAMGTGITLTAGTVEIFLDDPWNMALKEQAEDRCHRVGTTENVTIYTLLTKNTIDERIHSLIQEKGEMANMLVDGQIAGNKSEILDYLLG